MSFISELNKKRLFFDGAMGTMLQNRGLEPGKLPESMNITNPEVVMQIHSLYIQAGCNIIKTNTFGANPLKLCNTEYNCMQLFKSGVALAKQAAKMCNQRVYVAADIGPLGKLLQPLGELSFDSAYKAFSEMAIAGERSGADLILIETITNPYEAKAALLAAKENTNLPVVVTLSVDKDGKMFTGADVEAVVVMLEAMGADAVGLNCGVGPFEMEQISKRLSECTSLPLIFNPNAGMPSVDVNGNTVYNISCDEFAKTMSCLAENAAVLGGCCGTTPEILRETVELCKAIPVPEKRKIKNTYISSGNMLCRIGDRPIIIGERINPTGKSKFKQALKDKDINYILQEGIIQQQNGAHVLDVNVGLPEIDEVCMLTEVVTKLQSVVNLPLVLDTSDTVALEKALRYVNGKPIINSVNGKKESMENVFPLVKKYGGCVVALTLDENGIPETVQGRIDIAKRIIKSAKSYGIDKKEILVDVLTMAISAGMDARVTLEAIKEVKKLGAKTVLGVSNVSFGLPVRENINCAFFAMALNAGLDAAIINPCNQAMLNTYYSSLAVLQKDIAFKDYISKYTTATPVAADNKTNAIDSVDKAIISGLEQLAADFTKELLKVREPMDIINNYLIPALDSVGKDFEKGIVYLPQLLMSAGAAQSAFAVIKDYINKSNQVLHKKGKIVLATVKGDIHDIGKNIVKVLLENYGFDVVDLGKDVEPETILHGAKKHGAKIVGLSALMTTTVPYMEQTVRLIKKEYPCCKVVVGGAVLNEQYASSMGADRYAKDAMETVNFAKEVYE